MRVSRLGRLAPPPPPRTTPAASPPARNTDQKQLVLPRVLKLRQGHAVVLDGALWQREGARLSVDCAAAEHVGEAVERAVEARRPHLCCNGVAEAKAAQARLEKVFFCAVLEQFAREGAALEISGEAGLQRPGAALCPRLTFQPCVLPPPRTSAAPRRTFPAAP